LAILVVAIFAFKSLFTIYNRFSDKQIIGQLGETEVLGDGLTALTYFDGKYYVKAKVVVHHTEIEGSLMIDTGMPYTILVEDIFSQYLTEKDRLEYKFISRFANGERIDVFAYHIDGLSTKGFKVNEGLITVGPIRPADLFPRNLPDGSLVLGVLGIASFQSLPFSFHQDRMQWRVYSDSSDWSYSEESKEYSTKSLRKKSLLKKACFIGDEGYEVILDTGAFYCFFPESMVKAKVATSPNQWAIFQQEKIKTTMGYVNDFKVGDLHIPFSDVLQHNFNNYEMTLGMQVLCRYNFYFDFAKERVILDRIKEPHPVLKAALITLSLELPTRRDNFGFFVENYDAGPAVVETLTYVNETSDFQIGDRICSFNGKKLRLWSDRGNAKEGLFVFERNGETYERYLYHRPLFPLPESWME
jgi:hypothetical protein